MVPEFLPPKPENLLSRDSCQSACFFEARDGVRTLLRVQGRKRSLAIRDPELSPVAKIEHLHPPKTMSFLFRHEWTSANVVALLFGESLLYLGSSLGVSCLRSSSLLVWWA